MAGAADGAVGGERTSRGGVSLPLEITRVRRRKYSS